MHLVEQSPFTTRAAAARVWIASIRAPARHSPRATLSRHTPLPYSSCCTRPVPPWPVGSAFAFDASAGPRARTSPRSLAICAVAHSRVVAHFSMG